jgi:glycosyltransferase involved in cell wall biosynthesis
VHEAPQPVDGSFWGAEATAAERHAPFQMLFVGRASREKGEEALIQAWRASGLRAPNAALVLVGGGPPSSRASATSAVVDAGHQDPVELRNFYAGSDVVVVPSVPTRTIRETWSLVVNEAMHQGVPVIASDAVGAAAGGLVRDGRNGIVVPAGDPGALARAIRRLHDDPELRGRLGAAAREDVGAYTPAAWAEGVSAALASVGVAREDPLR